jgi:cell division ATPase FtsA
MLGTRERRKSFEKSILVGLDIGTSKICVVIGEPLPSGGMQILGVGMSPSEGLRQGVVINLDQAVMSIEKAVQSSALGFSPIVEEDRIRVSFPSLTEERKKQYIALLSKKAEIAKQDVRDMRNKGTRSIEKLFSKKKIGEDDKFRALDKLQEMVDGYNEKIEERRSKKEDLIMR